MTLLNAIVMLNVCIARSDEDQSSNRIFAFLPAEGTGADPLHCEFQAPNHSKDCKLFCGDLIICGQDHSDTDRNVTSLIVCRISL